MNSQDNQESKSNQSKSHEKIGNKDTEIVDSQNSEKNSQSSFQRPASKRLKIDATSAKKSAKTSSTQPNIGIDYLLERDTQVKYKVFTESQDDQQAIDNKENKLFKFLKIQDSKSEPKACKLRIDATHKLKKPKVLLKDSNLQTLLQIANIAQSQQAMDTLPTLDGQEFTCEFYDTESLMREPIKQMRIANGDSENTDVLDVMYYDKYRPGKKVDERFYCNQQMFRSVMPNDLVKFFWVLHSPGAEDFLNVTDQPKHYVQSCIFESLAGHQWQIRYQPGDWPNYGPNGKQKPSTTNSKITIFAIPSPKELEQGKIERQIHVSFQIQHSSENKKMFRNSNSTTMSFVHNLNDDPKTLPSQSIEEFFPMVSPQQMRVQGYSEQIYIEMDMDHQLFEEPNAEKEEKQPFKGLINEGTTCYMNSLLQTLYFLRAFRNAVYLMPSNIQNMGKPNQDQIQQENSNQIGDINQQENIPFGLQRIFYNLQLGKTCGESVRTHELLQAFGWSNNERNQQQDVNEFNCILSDQLERQMQNTELQGTYKNLFEGISQSVVQCTKIQFESSRDEVFNTLQLSVKGNETIEDSIKQYVEAENLDGDNQYDTEKFGKQDARKFIRFKEFPPVLQVSLNRFDYDPNMNRMVKNNQKFEFSEVLDLCAILPKESNESSQTQQNRLSQKNQSQDQKSQKSICDKVVNRFHLHSILVHKGTLDFGHYYAFIRPSITDEKWYEFNDADVKQVTKNYAFKQGCGGDFKLYDLQRGTNEDYEGSCATLNLKHIENNTNAYMLIYVRETEREAIMTDNKKLDEQIPKQLQDHFQMEERFRSQIEQDFNAYQNYARCYLITEDIFKQYNWGNLMLSCKFKNQTPSQLKFENHANSHLMLRIHHDVSINEFIQMIKNRFFKDDNDIELEDIWVYRIIQNQIQNQTCQYLINVSYDNINRWDVPMFTKSPAFTNVQWDQKGNNKWKSRIDNIYIYMTINPAKRPKFQLLKPIDEKGKEKLHGHYHSLIDYSRKSDMSFSNQYITMYQDFTFRSSYHFCQTSQILPEDIDPKTDEETKHTSDSNFAKNARDQFIFGFDSKIEAQQKDLHDCLIEERNRESSEKHQEIDLETQENIILSFVKVINTHKNNLEPKGHFFFDANKPIDLKQLLQVATDPDTAADLLKSPEKLKKVKVFLDPHSNICFHKSKIQESRQVIIHEESETYSGEIIEISVDKINSGPADYIERQGPIFNIHLGPSEYGAHQYAEMVDLMKSRVFAEVYQIHDENKQVHLLHWEQRPMDLVEFSAHDNYDDIADKICEIYNASLTGQYQQFQINKDMIQFFDKSYYEVTYQEYKNNKEFKEEGFIEHIITKPQCCLNFKVLAPQLRFSQVDQKSTILFEIKDHNSVLPHVQDCIIERIDTVKKLRIRLTRDFEIETYVLALIIDRATGYIKACAPDNDTMAIFVNQRGYGHAIEKNTDLLRLQILSQQEVELCTMISSKHKQISFATVKLFNQFRQPLFCSGHKAEQLLIPLCAEAQTFAYLIKQINRKVQQVLERGSNQIDGVKPDDMPIFLLEFKNRQTKMRSGRISQNSAQADVFYSNASLDTQIILEQHGELTIEGSIKPQSLEISSFPIYNFAVMIHQNFNTHLTLPPQRQDAKESVLSVSPKVSDSGRSNKEEKQ